MEQYRIYIIIAVVAILWIGIGKLVALAAVRLAKRFPGWWLSQMVRSEIAKHGHDWVEGEGPMLLALIVVWLPFKLVSLPFCTVLTVHGRFERWARMEKSPQS